MALVAGEKIIPETTLIIFDEIQECPEALHSLKYFKEKANEYHIVAAGSLLGTLLSRPKSYPVGMVNEEIRKEIGKEIKNMREK